MRTLVVILETLFWIILAMFVLVIAAAMGYVGIFFIMMLFPLAVRVSAAMRRRRGAAVVSYLEQAVRLNLPLAPMIAAAQASERGRLAFRLGRFANTLEGGTSVSTAVRLSVPELAGEPAAAIEASENLGRLHHSLRRIVQRDTNRAALDATDVAFSRAYPFVMAALLCTACSMLLVFVIPKYESIFRDFGTQLPWTTQFMLDVARAFGDILVVLTFVGVFGWILLCIWRTVHPRSAAWVLRGTRDQILWRLPLAHGYVRDRGMAEAFDLIAEAMRAGHPLDRAVDEASRLLINVVLRNRLADFASLLSTGVSLESAARQAKLPELVSQMLAPVKNGEQAVDVIAFLARYYDSRFSRTRVVLQAALTPMTVAFFGFFVAWVALGMLMPLNALIVKISQMTYRWSP